MPSIPRILEILFYSLAIFVPWLFVTLYPFRNSLRVHANLVALLAALMAAARIAVDMATGLGILTASTGIALILLAAYVLFYIISVRASLVEMAVNLVIVLVLAFATTSIVKNLEAVLTPSLEQAAYSWAYTVILLAMNGIIAVIYSLIYHPVKNQLQKLRAIGSKAANEEGSGETVAETGEAPAAKAESAPAPEVKEEKAESAPVPEAKEEKAASVPETKEEKAAPAPEVKEEKPAPEAKEKKAEPASAPEVKEEKPAPAPEVKEEKPAPEVKKKKAVSAPAPEAAEETSKSAPAVQEEKAEAAAVAKAVTVAPAPIPETPRTDVISTDQLCSMQYTSLNSRILESRQMRGNVRRSIDSMVESLNGKNYDKLRAQMLALRQQCTTTSYSKDVVLSVVLDYYAQICSNRGIHMNVNLQLPEDLSGTVNANDLIVILGNLLDNALDACKLQRNSNRHITVTGNLYGQTLRFVVENTYEQPVVQNEDGTYESTKYEGPGAGLRIVRHIANQYKGNIKTDHTNGLFQVTVTLNV